MNQLVTTSTSVTISSIDLVAIINGMREDGRAELRHDNFMVKVEKVFGSMSPKFLGIIKTSMPRGGERDMPCYYLPKREASLMVMSESYAVQAKVYDRMVELESHRAAPARVPTSFREALLLAAAQQEQLEEAQLQLSIAAPKVEVYDAVVADKNMTLSQFAKMLPGVNTIAIKKDLMAMNYLFKQGAHYSVYSKYRDVLFAHTIDGAYGTHDISVLAKGKELLVRLHADNRLTMKARY